MQRILLCAALLSGLAGAQIRPRDPFIFRGALIEKNRLVIVALNAQLTACYSTETCGLYMTWNGAAQDMNALYHHQGTGGQTGQCFTPQGSILHRQGATAWDLQQNGGAVPSKAVYKGFNLKGAVAVLRYAIVAGATTVNVEETPEYAAVGANPGLRSDFKVSGLPAGMTLRLRLSGSVRPETWTASGGGAMTGTNPQYLSIAADGNATLNGSWQP